MIIKNNKGSCNIDSISTIEGEEKDPNGIYLDRCTKEGIPDLVELTKQIVNFIEYIGTNEMEKLEKEDNDKFCLHIETVFPEFTLKYMAIYKMLLDKENREDNLIKLLNLFKILRDVKAGSRNIDREFDTFKENLAQDYVYPKFGGKAEFEKKIKSRADKKTKRKTSKKRK